MGLLSDMKVLYHLVLKPVRGGTHAERLESFYSGQAQAYDDFRKRLLKGRERLWELIEGEPSVWVDMGGGTGANLDFFGDRLQSLERVLVVDLAPSLLKVADQRIEQQGWTNVETIEADATAYSPETPVDVVTFSYSLTMIPDWFAAIDNALRMLKPGGRIGVVDFYVSRKHAAESYRQHGWFTRTFWPTWFNSDNVFPSPDHLPYLLRHFEPLVCEEHRAGVPYVPLVRTPYYIFVGRKPLETASSNSATQS